MASSIRFRLEAADGSNRDYDLSEDVEVSDAASQTFINNSYLGMQGVSRSPSVSSQGSELGQWESVASPQDGDSAMGLMDDKVCYGTICSIPIEFVRDSMVEDMLKRLIPIQPAGKDLLLLRLLLHETRTEVQTPAGKTVAVLDSTMHRVLTSLRAMRSISFQALYLRQLPGKSETKATKAPSESKSTKGKKAKKATGPEIEINVYGSNENADAVGEFLSHEDIFLQDPDWTPLNMRYDNPQLIKLPDYAYEDEKIDCVNRALEKGDSIDSTDSTNVELLRSDPNALLDKLASVRDLNEVTVDRRIRTQLLGHQRKGVDFMRRREAGSMLGLHEKSLWEKTRTDAGEVCFRHSITGHMSSDAGTFHGGLLADDMGLGKSLTVLATVAASLDHVPYFSQRMMAECGPSFNGPIPTTSTLVVVPSALLIDSWIEEINRHVHACDLTYYKYHGHRRKVPWASLLQHKVVFTTYGTVESELRRNSGVLHKVLWFRVVLDEAHLVRNESTKQFKGVEALQARIRWCLTGTPIQNGLEDLGTLMRFLKVPVLGNGTQFRRHISNPCTSKPPSFQNLQALLGHVCLRRSKEILHLPSETEVVHTLEFSEEEKTAYQRVWDEYEHARDSVVSGISTKDELGHYFIAILRQRVFCNNGSYFSGSSGLAMTDEEVAENLLQQSNSAVCYNCGLPIVRIDRIVGSPDGGFMTGCKRIMCSDCSSEYYEQSVECGHCSLCSEGHDIVRPVTRSQDEQEKPGARRYPTKVMTVCDVIEGDSESTKSIVFSFWTKSLDVLGDALRERGIAYLRIDGDSTLNARKNTLDEFKAMTGKAILLITFGIGAVGLNNLSVANRVHILEPQWNPYVESQAIGRLLRLGQQQRVQINRYVMRDTIEPQIQEKQIWKLLLAEGGFGEKQTAAARKEMVAKLKAFTRRHSASCLVKLRGEDKDTGPVV